MFGRDENELTGLEEHLAHEEGAQYGDPRRCPHHPHVRTSSPDGMFDAPCGECELLMSIEADENRTHLDMAREWVNVNKPELEGETYDLAVEEALVDMDLARQERARRQREQEELERSYDEDDIPF